MVVVEKHWQNDLGEWGDGTVAHSSSLCSVGKEQTGTDSYLTPGEVTGGMKRAVVERQEDR